MLRRPETPAAGPLSLASLLSFKPIPGLRLLGIWYSGIGVSSCLHLSFIKSLGWFILFPFGPGFLLWVSLRIEFPPVPESCSVGCQFTRTVAVSDPP